MALFLGIDTSTTATKALVIDDRGRVVAVASYPHEHSAPRPLWSEQDPEQWWEATVAAIRDVVDEVGGGDAIVSIGLTGQMHGLVMLDEDGGVVRPAMLWNDGRSSKQCEWMRKAIGLERLIELTGNDAFAGFTAPKLLWVKEHEPDAYARTRQILLPKDYLRFRLTGVYGTDRAGAGGTLLLDIRSRDWSDEVLDACGISRAWLPKTHEGPEVTGRVSNDAAAKTGLRAGTPVVAGGGDQAAGAVGVGAVRGGIISVAIGTSGVVFAPTDRPLIAPQGRAHAFPHAAPGCWHLMGVMLSAAGSLRWYRDTMAAGMDYDELLAGAATVPSGSEGLFFLPYLSGERTPHANPHARGAFVGLTLRHDQRHLTRAVLEGVGFGLRDNLALLLEAGLEPPEQVRISGGGSQNPVWRQILADILNVPLISVQTSEGAAFGAAILAGVGAGAWPDVASACDAVVITEDATTPSADAAAAYDMVYHDFRRLYPALEPWFDPSA